MKKSYFVLLIFLSFCVAANADILTIDTFNDYVNGTDLAGTAYLGTGWEPYAVGPPELGTWVGDPTIVTDGIATQADNWTLLTGVVDTSLGGYSALVGTTGIIGEDADIGGQTVYVGFIAGDNDGASYFVYGGIKLTVSGTSTALLIGNAWGDEQYSGWSQADGDLGLIGAPDNTVTVDDQLHLFVTRIDYVQGGKDTVTVWLDPDGAVAEESQTCPTSTWTTVGEFDNILLDCAGNGSYPPFDWSWDAVAITTTFADACEFTAGSNIRATNPAPANNDKGVATDTQLSWTAPADVTSPTYDVYLSTDANLPSGSQIENDITATTCDPGALDAASAYYWRVDVNSGVPVAGGKWTFETALPKALNPSPGDGDTNVARNAELSWDGGVDGNGDPPLSHRLYFDPNETLVAARDSGNVAVYVDLPPGTTTYDPDLAWDTQYFWIVDEVYTSETAEGDLWDFTVNPALACQPNGGDLNDDCITNIEDLRLIVANWLECTYTNDECP